MDKPKAFGWNLVDRDDGTWAMISTAGFFVAGFRSDNDALSWLMGFLDQAARRQEQAEERRAKLEGQLAIMREEMLARLVEPKGVN